MRYHAHRSDFEDRPRVSADDWKALAWLIAFAFIFVACTVVAAPR
jgi:hypothetical protein